MLTTQGWGAKLPDDITRLPIYLDDFRNIPEADQEVAVGKFHDRVTVGPFRAVILQRRDDILGWIQILPRAPFPDDVTIFGFLDHIVGPNLAFCLRVEKLHP